MVAHLAVDELLELVERQVDRDNFQGVVDVVLQRVPRLPVPEGEAPLGGLAVRLELDLRDRNFDDAHDAGRRRVPHAKGRGVGGADAAGEEEDRAVHLLVGVERIGDHHVVRLAVDDADIRRHAIGPRGLIGDDRPHESSDDEHYCGDDQRQGDPPEALVLLLAGRLFRCSCSFFGGSVGLLLLFCFFCLANHDAVLSVQ